MLVTPDFAFLHVPKCGGTTFRDCVTRSGIDSYETGYVNPCDPPTFDHAFHLLPAPDKWAIYPRTVMFYRPKVEWLRSYWGHRMRMGWRDDEGMALDQYKSDDFLAFARAVAFHLPFYVSAMFAAYAHALPKVECWPLAQMKELCRELGLPEPHHLNRGKTLPELGWMERQLEGRL